MRDPLKFFLAAARAQGDVALYRPAPEPAYLINRPEYAAHVLAGNWKNYSKQTYSNRMFRRAVGDGILTSEGERWKHARLAMQPHFNRRRLAAFDAVINHHCQAMLERWEAEAAAGRPIYISREMGLLTLSITLDALFGVTVGRIASTIGSAVDIALELLEKPRDRARFRDGRQAIADAVDEIVDLREQLAEPPDDLLAAIVAASRSHGEAEAQRQEVHNQVFTVLMAGYETTASALSWTWLLLSQHPDAARRAREEVAEVLGGRAPQAGDVGSLEQVRMVFEESLRVNPPAWVIGRKALASDRLDGHTIPAHAVIAVSPFVLHRHPDYWERPEQFDPQRFRPEHAAGRPAMAHLPFGAGPRKCLGENLAMLEAQLIIANVLQRFELRLLPDQDVRPQPLFILRPPTTVRMSLEPVR